MPCRMVKPEDASALACISVAAWQAAYRGLMPPEFLDALSAADIQTRWERVFAEGPPSVVVFERDQQVVASCHFGASRDPDATPGTAEVFSLNVHPDYWRRGLGSQLTTFALNRLRAEGFACVTLWVLRDNARAQRFYEALGFQRDSSERSTSDLIGSPLHELRYRMAFEPAA
jgi:ribosomal protein S18 acetylase RimI-like enzyme